MSQRAVVDSPEGTDPVTDAAVEVFWERGYGGVGLRELLATTGFNRRALYARFGGKDGLYAAALKAYRVRFIRHGIALLSTPDAGIDEIRELFRLRLGHDPRLGCFMLNSCGDRDQLGPELFDEAWDQHGAIEQGLRHCLRNAQAAGEVGARQSPDDLARYLMTVLHGISQLGRAGVERKALRRVVATALALVERADD